MKRPKRPNRFSSRRSKTPEALADRVIGELEARGVVARL